MTDDLIERLRNFEGSDALGNGDFSLLHEAAAALEAAREDSERLDTLDELILYSPDRALLLHHGVHKHREPSFWGLGLGNTGRTLRQAIDQARSVEDAPCAVAGQSPGRFYYVGGSAPVENGQRVRLVPEAGKGESHE